MIQIASLPKKLEHNRLLFISYITHTQRNLQIHNLPTKLETQQWNLRLAFYNLETQTLLLKPQNTNFTFKTPKHNVLPWSQMRHTI